MTEIHNIRQRDLSADILKTLVVIPMVIGHFIQLLLFQFGIINTPLLVIAYYINLVSFSCFYFAFGYSVSIAYLSKPNNIIWPKLIKNFIRLACGFYISSICFVLFIFERPTFSSIIKILNLRLVAGYSEFLLAFIFTIPIIFFLKKLLLKVSNWKILLISIIICFSFSAFPYILVKENFIGLFIGTTNYACFPIVQYLPCFLTGIYLQHHKEIIHRLRFDFTIIGYLIFILFVFFCIKDHAKRFPPSFGWIICSYIPILFYFKISTFLESKIQRSNVYSWIGRNVFNIVIISNIALFCAYKVVHLFVQ